MPPQRFICLAFFVLLSLMYCTDCARRSFNVIWINATCIDTSDIAATTCGTKEINNKVVMNLKTTILKDVYDMESHIVIDVIRTRFDNVRIFDIKFDGCKFLQQGSKENVVKILYSTFRRYGTFPFKCPVLKGNTFLLNNFYLESEYLPPYTPEETFHFVNNMSANGTQFLSLTVYGMIAPKRPNRMFTVQPDNRN